MPLKSDQESLPMSVWSSFMKTLTDVLQKAEHERFTVGHFNFSDLVAFNVIAAAARKLHLPGDGRSI
jgi:hypothetical protein